ncbi:MAG: hypothetical protein SFU53_10470 [Terrimicrobiaceae bacterium]|nr:hypothetical protein [Terrimicrobiaceae bacterium]
MARAGKFLPLVIPNAGLVRAVGDQLTAEVEDHPNPMEIDHVRITMDIGRRQRVFVSINTHSKRNRIAGFDPRVRVGRFRTDWKTLPALGLSPMLRFDYADVERSRNVFFEHWDREALESALLEVSARTRVLEAWGAPYRNQRPGIHQIHSRRASCAVADDLEGRDGGLTFYFDAGHEAETWLFKFCGQA